MAAVQGSWQRRLRAPAPTTRNSQQMRGAERAQPTIPRLLPRQQRASKAANDSIVKLHLEFGPSGDREVTPHRHGRSQRGKSHRSRSFSGLACRGSDSREVIWAATKTVSLTPNFRQGQKVFSVACSAQWLHCRAGCARSKRGAKPGDGRHWAQPGPPNAGDCWF